MRRVLSVLCPAVFMGLFLLVSAIPAFASGDVSVEAATDRTSLAMGETLRLTVTVRNAQDARVDLSPLKDFQAVSEQKNASLTLDGQNVIQVVVYVYRLAPEKPGKARIPALAVSADGETLKTKPIAVTVAVEPPAGSGPNGASAEKAVFLETEVTREAPYVGEQFLYKTRIYRSVPLASANLRDPDFTGFAATRSPGQRDYETVIGKTAYVVSEVTYLLTPLEAKTTVIKGAVLQCDMIRQKKGRTSAPMDPFFLGADVESRVFSAPSVTLNAQALPPYRGEGTFSGLIGQFSITASANANELATGASATLAVTITGRGNLMDAPDLDVAAPGGCKLYKDAPEERIELTGAGYAGESIRRYSLVALVPGAVTLAPISLNYFDPEKKAYRTASTQPLSFTVSPAAQDAAQAGQPGRSEPADAEGTPAPTSARSAQKSRVDLTGDAILPLYEGLDAVRDERPMVVWVFFLLFVLPPAGYGAMILALRRLHADPDPAERMAAKARQALAEALTENQTRSGGEIISLCAKALTAAILSRSGREGEAVTYEEAGEILAGAGLSPNEAARAVDVLRRLDAARYGGAAGDREALLAETAGLLGRLCP